MGKKLNFVLKVLFPFSSIKKSVSLIKKETFNSKDRWNEIRMMAKEIKNNIRHSESKNDSFNAVLSTSPYTRDQLISIFITKKNIILSGFYIFLLFIFFSLLTSFLLQNTFGVICSVVGGLMCIALNIAVLFQYQFRLWQLQVKRLSLEEQGSISDFMHENKRWFFLLLKFQKKAVE